MKKLFLLAFLLKLIPAHGQSVVHHQALYWIRYQNHLNLTPRFYLINEIDNRRFFGPDVQNQLIMHSRLHYQKDRWNLAAGLTFSWIYAQIPENGYDHSTSEVRPVIEGSYELPAGKVLIQQRIRIDNRFLEENEEQTVWENSLYVLRFRYRLQARIPLKVNDEGMTTIMLRISDEIMVNSKENTFDQNRIYASTEFTLNKNFTLETGYIYIYQQRFGRDEFFSRNVLRISLLHLINLKSARKS